MKKKRNNFLPVSDPLLPLVLLTFDPCCLGNSFSNNVSAERVIPESQKQIKHPIRFTWKWSMEFYALTAACSTPNTIAINNNNTKIELSSNLQWHQKHVNLTLSKFVFGIFSNVHRK